MSFESDLLELVPRLRRFAASLSRDRAEGDDLCQAALVRALGLREQRQWQPRLDIWMYRIVRNLWIDRGHAQDRPAEDATALFDLHHALHALPDEQREAIALVLIEGLSYDDAAGILGVPMGTLTSRLARGRGALGVMMGQGA